MKALAIERQEGPGSVRVMDLPEPSPSPGEVLVEVRAAALNHLDLWTIGGSLGIEIETPFVLGADGAGVIHEIGEGVRGLRKGTEVIINPALSCRRCERCRAGEQSECVNFRMMGEHVSGTFAERVAVPATNVFPFPGHLSFGQAAALGVTSITAYRMLFTKGRLRPGEWLLVTGIGGGLALSLLQLARGVCGRIYVTSSSDAKLERAGALGADAGINYRDTDVGVEVRRLTGKRGVDLVADSAGGTALDGALRSLAPGGRVVVAGATAGRTAEIDVRRLFWKQLQIIGSTMGSDSDVADMLRAVAGKKLEPVIDSVYEMDEGRRAVEKLASGDHFGKIVLTVP